MALSIGVILSLIEAHPRGYDLDHYLARKAEFVTRSQLGRDPKIDGRLKFFVFDDPALFHLQRELNLTEWANILEALDKRRPSAILIDKVFALPDDPEKVADFTRRVHALDTKIIAAAFISQSEISARPQLALTSLNRIAEFELSPGTSQLHWLPVLGGYAYGPHRDIISAFDKLGQINYASDGRVWPFFRVDQEHSLPHLSLLTAKDLAIGDHGPIIGNEAVPIDRNGQIVINLGKPSDYYAMTYSMQALITFAESGRNIPVVDPGDVVFIAPKFYTGHTDFAYSPHGTVPGSILVASLINSVLTEQWLYPFPFPVVNIFAGVVLGFLLGSYFSALPFYLLLVLGALMISALGLGSFIYLQTILPWLMPMFAYLATAFTIFIVRSKNARTEEVRLAQELETAKLVQSAFFPKEATINPSLTIAGSYTPATECSGDWWGRYSISSTQELIMIGDATGHGASAALVTASIWSSATTQLAMLLEQDSERTKASPGRILDSLNRILFDAMRGKTLMTCFVALIDTEKGSLTFSNAGHNLPALFPRGEDDDRQSKRKRKFDQAFSTSPIFLVTAGNPLGISKETNYREMSLPIRPGDRILFFTDGLIEARNAKGKAFGLKRMIEKSAALSTTRPSASDMVEGLFSDLNLYRGSRSLDDDVTVVVCEVSKDWQPKESAGNLAISR